MPPTGDGSSDETLTSQKKAVKADSLTSIFIEVRNGF